MDDMSNFVPPNKEIARLTLHRKRRLSKTILVKPFLVFYLLWVGLYLLYGPFLTSAPPWGAFTCTLGSVTVLHMVIALLSLFHSRMKLYVFYENVQDNKHATHVFIRPVASTAKTAILMLYPSSFLSEPHFAYTGKSWFWDADRRQFRKPELPTRYFFKDYQTASGYGEDSVLEKLVEIHGVNRLEIHVPSISTLILERFSSPVFMFQMVSILFWCLEAYWVYMLVSGAFEILLEVAAAKLQYQNFLYLSRHNAECETLIECRRGGRWKPVHSQELVPGDLIFLPLDKTDLISPCDFLLLRGTVTVNEALLTGESIPVVKRSTVHREPAQRLCLAQDRGHIIFRGTQLLSVMEEETMTHLPSTSTRTEKNLFHFLASPRGTSFHTLTWEKPPGALGFVLRTGSRSLQGKLMSKLISGQGRVGVRDIETFNFLLFFLAIALCACAIILWRGMMKENQHNGSVLMRTCVRLLVSVIPVDLPIQCALIHNAALLRLSHQRVYCVEPSHLPEAGRITHCGLDKTGTLTYDTISLHGVVEGDGSLHTSMEIYTKEMWNEDHSQTRSSQVAEILSACQNLFYVHRPPRLPTLVGDPLELAAFRAVGWEMNAPSVVSDPRGKRSLVLLKRFDFNPHLRRMSVLAQTVVQGRREIHVLCKGAPEILFDQLTPSPPAFHATYRRYGAQGYRVLALAFRKLPDSFTPERVDSLTRAEVERELQFLAFALFSTPIKKDTSYVIRQLRSASCALFMITGDASSTAIAVARKIQLFPQSFKIKTIAIHKGRLIQYSREGNDKPFFGEKGQTHGALCVTGEAFTQILRDYPKWIHSNIKVVTIWSRCSPEIKEHIIKALQRRGCCVFMIGDGTNDLAALHQANVSLSVLGSAHEDRGEMPRSQLASLSSDSILPPLRDLRLWKIHQGKNEGSCFGRKLRSSSSSSEGYNNLYPSMQNGKGQKKIHFSPTLGYSKNVQGTCHVLAQDASLSQGQLIPLPPLGQASLASSFSSLSPQLHAVLSILHEGRGVLSSTTNIFKILALQSLITLFTMVILTPDEIKFSEIQMIFLSLLPTIATMKRTQIKPSIHLVYSHFSSKMLSPSLLYTILLQGMVHFGCLLLAKQLAHKTEKINQSVFFTKKDESFFAPSCLNSVIFQLANVMSLSTLWTNTRNSTYSKNLEEKGERGTMWYVSGIFLLGLNLEISPMLNKSLGLVACPSRLFRWKLVSLSLTNFLLTYTVDYGLYWLLPSPS